MLSIKSIYSIRRSNIVVFSSSIVGAHILAISVISRSGFLSKFRSEYKLKSAIILWRQSCNNSLTSFCSDKDKKLVNFFIIDEFVTLELKSISV